MSDDASAVVDVEPTAATPASEGERRRNLRRAAYLTIGLGVAFSALYILSYFLLQQTPGPTATDAEIVTFYSAGGQRRLILIGLYVMPFAGIAYLWFIIALRMWIEGMARRVSQLLSNVQFVSGIIFIGLLFTAGAASAATAASMEFARGPVDPMLARQLPQLSSTILLVFAMRMAAMFVFTTSNIGRASRILPRWFVYLGFAVGLFLLLSATFNRLLALVFPVWVLLLCVILYTRARAILAEAVVPPAGRSTARGLQG
jgi:hypothetical protein